MSCVLIVEDDADLRGILASILEANYTIVAVPNVSLAKQALSQGQIDLVLVDLQLPDGSGFEVCTYVKSNDATRNIPVLIVSGIGEVSTKVAGFELGADDYIQKPFSKDELFARVKAKLRAPVAPATSSTVRKGRFIIDENRQKISVTGVATRDLNLSPMEFRILHFLIRNDGRIHSRDRLISVCRGAGYAVVDRSIDTHIYSLRKKLSDTDAGSISTHYGSGYSFEFSPESGSQA